MSDPPRYVLSTGTRVMPLGDLPASARRRVGRLHAHSIVLRPGSRRLGKLLDAAAATLVGQFVEPTSLVDAVVACSGRLGLDPRRVLEDAYQLVASLLADGVLVPAGPADATGAGLPARASVGGYPIRTLIAVREDTEVYQVGLPDGSPAALKLARSPRSWVADALRTEARILRHLDGAVAPRLLDARLDADPPFLVVEWCEGLPMDAAADLRRLGAGNPGRALHRLASRLLEGYAGLHERGVVHGDVQPANVLVGTDDTIRVVDYGSGLLLDDHGPVPGRGGMASYFEPEYAAALVAGRTPPPPTPAGEQYALAALCYRAIAGAPYFVDELDELVLLERIVAEPPLLFIHRAVRPWPTVESVLARALAKDPSNRFPSVRSFADALRVAAPRTRHSVAPAALAPTLDQALERFTSRDTLARGLPPPAASVSFGAAGAACFLYRAALTLGRSKLLDAAVAWLDVATRAASDDTRAYAPAIGVTADSVGRTSLLHGSAGIECVRALAFLAGGVPSAAVRALSNYVEAGDAAPEPADIATGKGGLLLGCSLLTEALRPHGIETPGLDGLARQLVAGLWSAESQASRDAVRGPGVDAGGAGARGRNRPDVVLQAHDQYEPAIDPSGQPRRRDASLHAPPELGMAHGLAGTLYVTSRWSLASGDPMPSPAWGELEALEGLGQRHGRRASWPRIPGGNEHWVGWCHGSAGFVHLWAAAHAVSREDRHLALAVAAGEDVWARPSSVGDLCCGLAGQAYALLALYRVTGARRWLERARLLAAQAARHVGSSRMRPGSLYRGELGVAALEADLLRPELAAMPLFGSEGWPDGR